MAATQSLPPSDANSKSTATEGGCQCTQRGLSRCYCKPRETKAEAEAEEPVSAAEGDGEEFVALRRAREEASRGRDVRRGKQALVDLWREASKPRKGGAVPAQPAGCKLDFPGHFDQWLGQRGLQDALRYDRDEKGWAIYRYTREPLIRSESNWEVAFHGTWWYAVWLILESGLFLESNDRSLGHDFWEPGVYCSPSLDTGLWYARPQILFADGVYHRVIFELRVDPDRRKKDRKRGGIQWVFPSAGVALHSVWIRSNAPPANGEERVNSWEPELEALPSGREAPAAIINARTQPWPHVVDPWPFDLGDNSVPPWMSTPKPCGPSPGDDGRSLSVAVRALAGGLYGRWLKEAREGRWHPGWRAIVNGSKLGAAVGAKAGADVQGCGRALLARGLGDAAWQRDTQVRAGGGCGLGPPALRGSVSLASNGQTPMAAGRAPDLRPLQSRGGGQPQQPRGLLVPSSKRPRVEAV